MAIFKSKNVKFIYIYLIADALKWTLGSFSLTAVQTLHVYQTKPKERKHCKNVCAEHWIFDFQTGLHITNIGDG